MSYARAQQAARRRIVIFQVLLISAVAVGFFAAQGWQSAVAVIYGALIVTLNHLLQVRQLKRADRIAGIDPARNMRYLYRCAAERFTATVALLAVGIIMLRLEPLPLLAGYILAQFALVYRWFLESSARRKHG
jgi:ATP synthase protein I